MLSLGELLGKLFGRNLVLNKKTLRGFYLGHLLRTKNVFLYFNRKYYPNMLQKVQ